MTGITYSVTVHAHDIFAEKPIAVDGPGVRRVLAACEEARRNRLSVVSGLCWRYHNGMRETFKRIHEGAVGDIVTLQCNYLTGTLWHRARTPEMSDTEWQIRNWYNFVWLSGDSLVEQAVHNWDVMNWAIGSLASPAPQPAYGSAGGERRTRGALWFRVRGGGSVRGDGARRACGGAAAPRALRSGSRSSASATCSEPVHHSLQGLASPRVHR